MSYSDNYFQLRWNYVDGNWTYTRRFHMILQESHHQGVRKATTYTRNEDNQMVAVRVPLKIRWAIGHLRISDTQSNPWGTLAEAKLAWEATDLEAKLYADAAFWKAEWITPDWDPIDLSPVGNHVAVLMELEQRE